MGTNDSWRQSSVSLNNAAARAATEEQKYAEGRSKAAADAAALAARPPAPEWSNGMSSQDWMGRNIYGQNDQWYMDNGGTQQDITGLYGNYNGYQAIDNGLAAGLMVQGDQNNLIQGWDGNFYSDMFPSYAKRDSIGFDGYDFTGQDGQEYSFNKNGNDLTSYLGWKPTENNHIGLAASIFGTDNMIKGNNDQIYSKYGLTVGGLDQNKDFVKDYSYTPEDGKFSAMYDSVSDPDFSVRDYQMYEYSDPLGSANAKDFWNASHSAGWDPILSPTDPILIDKTAYGEGYETWGRFSKYAAPVNGGSKGTSYWNYYPEADTKDEWLAGSVDDYVKLGKSASGHYNTYNPNKLNSDLKNSLWINDDTLGTGFTFKEEDSGDYGYAPSTGSMDLKKTPSWQKWVGPLLTVASFIPGINAVAIPLNAAYNVGMGIKNDNWGQVAGGVLGGLGQFGAFGDASGASGALGSGGSAGAALGNALNISPALGNALVSGGLGAISGGWEGALAGGRGSYAGSYVGSTVGDATQNYNLGTTMGGLTNSMINQMINTGQLNEELLTAQGLSGALNSIMKGY